MTVRLILCVEALTVGGAEQMLVALANGFVSRGIEVHMICLAKAGELADQLDSQVQLHVLGKKRGVDLALLGKLRACILTIDPVAINSHLWVANLWTRLALLGTRFKVAVTEHSRDTWKPAYYRWLDRLLAHRAQALIAVSQDTADFYRNEIRIGACPIVVINNGVDTERYAAGDGHRLRSQWIGSADFLIGTVGRLVPAKNHPRLLDALRRLLNSGLNVRLVIVGDGEERERLERAVIDQQLQDHVILAGSRSDVPDVLAALDVFVLSSDREGHPLTALEAQAAGTPVVLTDAGGAADAIAHDGSNRGGILVPRDPGLLANALASLLSNDGKRRGMGRFGQLHALAHFDRDHMIDAYAESLQLPVAVDTCDAASVQS